MPLRLRAPEQSRRGIADGSASLGSSIAGNVSNKKDDATNRTRSFWFRARSATTTRRRIRRKSFSARSRRNPACGAAGGEGRILGGTEICLDRAATRAQRRRAGRTAPAGAAEAYDATQASRRRSAEGAVRHANPARVASPESAGDRSAGPGNSAVRSPSKPAEANTPRGPGARPGGSHRPTRRYSGGGASRRTASLIGQSRELRRDSHSR